MNKMNKEIVTIAAITGLMLLAAKKAAARSRSALGMNYDTLYHRFDPKYTPDEVQHRDFARFKEDGITLIRVGTYWAQIEPTSRGVYNDIHLGNIRHTIELANEYGIKTMLTAHTTWNNTWYVPTWADTIEYYDPYVAAHPEKYMTTAAWQAALTQDMSIIRNPNTRQAFLAMFTHCCEFFRGTPGLIAWNLNEPWWWPLDPLPELNGINQQESMISLIDEMNTISHQIGDVSFTCGFVSASSRYPGTNAWERDFAHDPRIRNLDIIGFNIYWHRMPQIETDLDKYAQDYAKWLAETKRNVATVKSWGKPLWVTETGGDGSGGYTHLNPDGTGWAPDDPRWWDDEGQLALYQQVIPLLESLKVNAIMPWSWRADSMVENPGLPGKSFNLAADALGNGRPAYYYFVRRLA